MALNLEVEVVVCAFGTPTWVVERSHDAGAKVVSIVGTARAARRAILNGTDAIIGSGFEAGAHNGEVGLLTLLTQILEFAKVPVVGAGGIVNGAQIAAILTVGGSGVWVGTRFAATEESGTPQAHKDAIVEVEHDRTVRTLAMDALPSRLIRNRFTEVWNGHEAEICSSQNRVS